MAPVAMRPAQFAAAGVSHSPVFVGSGVAAYPESFGEPRFVAAIQASVIGRLALAFSAAGEIQPARPVYVRPSEAEVKFGAAPAHDALSNLI